MQVIQERDSNNVPTVSYTRGNDLSGSMEGAGGIGGLLARSSGYSGGNWTIHNYYFADGNGNVTYILNSSQAMVASYRYDPFGSTISSSGTLASANVYRFSSKEIHVASGMYYYGYRFYDPNLQRWINRDQIQERGGYNLFASIKNDPANRIDLLGLLDGPLGWPWPSINIEISIHDITQMIQNVTPLGGRCSNHSGSPEWALVDGHWVLLKDGESTGIFQDCDGMTCGGGFYAVYSINGDCKTPGKDDGFFCRRRWTPDQGGPSARSPAWQDPAHPGRGSHEGNTPPDYKYHPLSVSILR